MLPRQTGSPGNFATTLRLAVVQDVVFIESPGVPGGPTAPGTCASVWAVETTSRSSEVAVNGDIFWIWSLLKYNTILSNLWQFDLILVQLQLCFSLRATRRLLFIPAAFSSLYGFRKTVRIWV